MSQMDKKTLCRMIDTAMHRVPADLVIKNCQVVDVYSGVIRKDSIAISEGYIVGFGDDYEGSEEIDAQGAYASPGLIDAHIHIESSHTTPEEFGRLVVPKGTTTVIADPHEIVNVCGLQGFNYMIRASEKTELSIRYMMPSCVPATPFEDSGAVVNAFDLQWPMADRHVPGLAEFMNVPGVTDTDEEVINKLLAAKRMNKVIDGHAPAITGAELNAYASVGIATDHECSTPKEMLERIERGIYVQLREGTACHDLKYLIPAITPYNYRRCLLCSDDRQTMTIIEKGQIDNHLRMLVEAGIDPVMAITMGSLNAAECYKLDDRGAIAPGKRADIVLFNNLKEFKAQMVFIKGRKVAQQDRYLPAYEKTDISTVRGSMHVKPFRIEDLKMHLKSDQVHAIEIVKDGVTTKDMVITVKRDETGDFIFDPNQDVAKIAVIERHHNTGHIGLGLLKDYGIQKGAIALSVAHDSHNIICVGVSNEEMNTAIRKLIDQEGGFVMVENGEVIASLALPVAGLMSDLSGEEVSDHLRFLHDTAIEKLGVSEDVDPITTLYFMSLIVIPELKISTRGLFDVRTFRFVPIEADAASE